MLLGEPPCKHGVLDKLATTFPTFETLLDYISTTLKNDGFVCDKEGMDDEGF